MRYHEIKPLVYHGSDLKGLTILEPRPTHLIDQPVVFATPSAGVAIAMSGHWTDDDFSFGRVVGNDDNNVPYTMQELWPGAFKKFFSTTRWLYCLDAKAFSNYPELQDFEVASQEPVAVVHVIKVEDPMLFLAKSLHLNIQMY